MPKASTSSSIWQPSSPPREDFSTATGAEEDGGWTYAIIGEEVDFEGDLNYEVRWDNWHREDGTKTTWQTVGDGSGVDVSAWDDSRRKEFNIIAKDGVEMKIQSTTDIHNTRTYERNQAHEQKRVLGRSKPASLNLFDDYLRVMDHHARLDRLEGREWAQDEEEEEVIVSPSPPEITSPSPARVSKRRLNSRAQSVASSSTLAGPSYSSSTLAGPSRSPSTRAVSNFSADRHRHTSTSTSKSGRPKKKAKITPVQVVERPRTPTPDSDSDIYVDEDVYVDEAVDEDEDEDVDAAVDMEDEDMDMDTGFCQLSRAQLQKQWTKAAGKTGAAEITFVNLVDDEEIPRISADFVYLESSYRFADDVDRPPLDMGFFMICTCKSCEHADICGCQGESMVIDPPTKSKVFAYTPKGLFKFNVLKGVEVIECNQFCKCKPSTCPNRVSQRPRDIPIEIFKTDERGWGVRSRKSIRRGKVLGMYTGLVIRRESYANATDDESMYIFDLDGNERDDEENRDPDELYSVDAMYQGNWTRFINHSCGPNLEVYLVVHDVPPGTGKPFIVFVAREDVPAMTEFTLDYDPKAAEALALAKAQGKGKKKAKQPVYEPPSGGQRCSCGSPLCRGFMP